MLRKMGEEKTYRIIDFTEYPGPRYRSQGNHSGEEFYWSILKGLFEEINESNGKLIIDLDGTAGYASSFLDEAFGNLAYDFGERAVLDHIEIVSHDEPDWNDIILKETIPEWHKKKREGVPRKPDLLS